MNNLRLLLLFALVCFSLSSFANKFIVDSFKPDPKDLSAQNNPRKDGQGQSCAIVKVITDIEGLTFTSSNGIVGSVEVKQGAYWVYVSPGEKSLRISKQSFTTLEVLCSAFNIKIESSAVYTMQIKPENPEFSLLDILQQKGDLNLSTVPGGASITIDGEPDFKGVTPYHFVQHSAGTFKVSLQKENYEQVDTVIQFVPDSVTNMTIPLSYNVSHLYLKVNPSPPTSKIYIDGQMIEGVDDKVMFKINSGLHKIYVSGNNWSVEERTINVGVGKTDSLFINRTSIMGKIKVNITPSSIDKAEIWMNDKKTAYFAPGEFPFQTGIHTITIKKEGFPVKSQMFSLTTKETLTLNFSLTSFVDYQKQFNRQRLQQNIWMVSALAFGAAGGYLSTEADTKYKQYLIATGPDANTLHTTIVSYQQMVPVAFALAAISTIEFTWHLFKKNKNKYWLNFQTDGQKVALTAKF